MGISLFLRIGIRLTDQLSIVREQIQAEQGPAKAGIHCRLAFRVQMDFRINLK
jgi:hypothetical protein